VKLSMHDGRLFSIRASLNERLRACLVAGAFCIY
jgi:hypothetical protein